ncbi:MAG: sulfotransferase family protein [PVC group bacterium]|nr:sulfotransferase family protein [PVC group bacterium]
MRYSKKHKKLFVHIPRCAGKSIVVMMKSHYKDVRLVNKSWTHSRLKDVRKNIDLSKYEKIAVVRNPWERMVSLYCFLRQRKAWFDTRKGKKVLNKNMPEFTDWLINYGKKSHNIKTSDTPQFDWVSLNGKVAVDHLIRYEKLEKGVKKAFGFCDLAESHTTYHSHWKTYYNEKSDKYIRRIFKKDIEVFGYEF